MRAPLADFAVTADDCELAADHHVGRAVQAVDHRMTAAIDVVELRLRHRIVDVDRGEEQRARLHHLVEAMNAGRCLLGHSLDVLGYSRPPARMVLGFRAQQIQDDAPLFRIILGIERRNLAGLLELRALVHEQRRIAAVVEQHVRTRAVGPYQRLFGAPPVLLERLALPRKHRNALRLFRRAVASHHGRSRGVILRREDVARDPAHIGAKICQRLDEHRRLDGHVQRAHDLRALERLLARGHEAGHLLLRQADLLAPPFGEREVLHLEGRPVVRFGLRFRRVAPSHLCGTHECSSSMSSSRGPKRRGICS